MVVILINVFTIVIASIALSLIINEDLYKTIPTITISMPIIMMFVGFFCNLDVSVGVIYALAFVSLVLALIKKKKDKTSLIEFFNNNKFVLIVYIIIAIYFIFVNYKRPAWGWDEFSHWARVVKNMNYTRHLNRSTDVYLSFPHYPPNVSLFLYFFDYQKVFNEWQLFYAQSLYTVTLVFPIAFYIGKNKSNLYKLLLLLLAISIPSSISVVAYISLFVDNIMGVLIGYAMIEYLFNDNIKYKLINIILALMALTLTKDAGTILSLIFIVIIFINELYIRINNKDGSTSKLLFKYIFLMVLFVILAYNSYKLYLSLVGINNINYAKTYSQSLLNMNSWAPTTIKNFYHKIFEYSFGNIFKISVVNIIMIFIILSTILYKFINNDQLNNSNMIIWGTISLIVYLLLLLYTYICRFSEYESVNLASFDRYISTYLLFMLVVIISLFTVSFPKTHSLIIIISVFALLFNPIQGIFQISLGATYNKNNVTAESRYYESKSDFIKKYIGANDVVSIISIGNANYNAMRISYSLGPEYKTYYIGEPTTSKDGLYSNVLTPEELINKFKDNDVKFIYLDSVNDKFIDEYSVLFENKDDIKNNNIFAINNNKLKKIGE